MDDISGNDTMYLRRSDGWVVPVFTWPERKSYLGTGQVDTNTDHQFSWSPLGRNDTRDRNTRIWQVEVVFGGKGGTLVAEMVLMNRIFYLTEKL